AVVLARRRVTARPGGPLELVATLPLGGRRAVHLIRVEGRVLVVGASEAGLTRLGEVEPGRPSAEPGRDP
ncbi:MAG: flagellar biosynthetic protein FliO, partial [Deltaproteobacteria bacterium]|nr:flagellar biosynthetic protein FliO [Deltaproteobacteria bacterium]